MKTRLASPEKSWRDITPEHAKLRSSVEESIGSLSGHEELDPLAVVGPYRCGKTQILYHAFEYAWEHNIPALYTDAQSIFSEFESSESSSISTWLSERVSSQVDRLLLGETVDWLPNWHMADLREDFVSGVSDSESVDTSQVVLLVDEIEQAYTNLRSSEFVDDENPLRVLIDDTTGVYQVWAFGLVSAYEFLGEADFARFHEVRLPLLSVRDVYDRLEQQDKTVELANGIWWLARGRIGWINKLVEEAPSTDQDLSDWVSLLGSLDFDGATPINKEVWTEGSVNRNKWDNARRAALYLRNEYTDWEIEANDGASIRSDDVKGLTLDIILSESKLSLTPDSKEVIERNLSRLCDGLSPVDIERPDHRGLPANLINERKEARAFLDLLEDLILSFEGRGERRAKAIEAVDGIDAESFRIGWSDRFYNHIDDGGSAWAIRPSVLAEAYPAVGVDPTNLTDITRSEIESNLSDGIRIEAGNGGMHASCEIYFCPNTAAIESVIGRAKRPRDISTTIICISPDNIEDYEIDSDYSELEDLHRISFKRESAGRLWDFVIHLYHYITVSKEISEPITSKKIERVLDEEEDREKRNTIQSLYEQVENISSTAGSEAIRQFTNYYSSRNRNVPIWGDKHLEDDGPPGMYGSASTARVGLDYALVCSSRGPSPEDSFIQIPERILYGIDEEYVDVEAQKFGFQNFLKYIFTDGVYSSPVQEIREEYIPASGGRITAIDHVQEYLLTLTNEDDLLERLTDMSCDIDDFDVLSNTAFEYQLAPMFLWGIMLDGVAQESADSILDDLNGTYSRQNNLIEELNRVTDRIDNRNAQLSAYKGHGRGVTIRSEGVSAYQDHLIELSELTSALIEDLQETQSLATLAMVLEVILDTYIRRFNDRVDMVKGTVYDSSLLELKKLRGQFDRFESQLRDITERTKYIQFGPEELDEIISETGGAVFDFQRNVGSKSIEPNDQESFDRIISWAESRSEALSDLNSQMEEVSALLEKKSEKKRQSRESFRDFYEIVMEGG